MNKKQLFEEIKNEMKQNGIYDKPYVFACFMDNIFTYKMEEEGIYIEINIICDDNYMRNESLAELVNKKRISYFQHSIYLKNGADYERISNKEYGPIAECRLN